jgi:hypothetical protein
MRLLAKIHIVILQPAENLIFLKIGDPSTFGLKDDTEK